MEETTWEPHLISNFDKRDAASAVIEPDVEHEFWRNEFAYRPYVAVGSSYEEYARAYQYGWESYESFAAGAANFRDVEAELGQEWAQYRGKSHLSWSSARAASQDAWRRVQNAAWGRAYDQG